MSDEDPDNETEEQNGENRNERTETADGTDDTGDETDASEILSCTVCPFQSARSDMTPIHVSKMQCPNCNHDLQEGPHKQVENKRSTAVAPNTSEGSNAMREAVQARQGEIFGSGPVPVGPGSVGTGRHATAVPSVGDQGPANPPLEDYREAFIQLAGTIRGMRDQANAEMRATPATQNKQATRRFRTLDALAGVVDDFDPAHVEADGDE